MCKKVYKLIPSLGISVSVGAVSYKNYLRGKSAELMLGRKLLSLGFFVMRAPASGRRAKKFKYPDLVAIRKGEVLLFEVKLRKHRDTIHIPWRQVENLRYASQLCGGRAYIAVYVQEDKKWFFFRPESLGIQKHEKGRRYVITVSMYEKALKFSDVVTQ